MPFLSSPRRTDANGVATCSAAWGRRAPLLFTPTWRGRPRTEKPALVLGALRVAESVTLVCVFLSSSRLLTKIKARRCCTTSPSPSSNAWGPPLKVSPRNVGSDPDWELDFVQRDALTCLCLCVHFFSLCVYMFTSPSGNLHISASVGSETRLPLQLPRPRLQSAQVEDASCG